MALKLGLTLGTGGNTATVDMDYVREAENLGYDTVWTAEAWGSDALTPAAWVLNRANVGPHAFKCGDGGNVS
jgi:alkanesulfonate monooxygenase SsuD/methylene tetrahydromethanopterin reductase-like flavin-dependent oxidoreductase (luciferase family)